LKYIVCERKKTTKREIFESEREREGEREKDRERGDNKKAKK